MLKLKLLTILFVTILILTIAKENEVDAAPEPCSDFFRFPKFRRHKKSKDDDEKSKEEKKKKKMENFNLIEKFLQGLFSFK